jgi:hypothetical protein
VLAKKTYGTQPSAMQPQKNPWHTFMAYENPKKLYGTLS